MASPGRSLPLPSDATVYCSTAGVINNMLRGRGHRVANLLLILVTSHISKGPNLFAEKFSEMPQ